jgi:DNA-binding transcriptional regulator YiaG
MTGAEIREKRKSLGLTQGSASRLFHVGDRTWRRWEAGIQTMDGPAERLLAVVTTVPAAWQALLDFVKQEKR